MTSLNKESITRYRSQLLMREVGELGQAAINRARILIIGAGGLGCPAALYLGGAGIGKIGLIDADTVELGNLHRQVAYTNDDIGRPKVEALAQAISMRNPNVEVVTYPMRFSRFNAELLTDEYDMIIDGSDNFATRFIAADAAADAKKPYVFGAASGFMGQLSVFAPHIMTDSGEPSPTFRCLVSSTITDEPDAPCASGILGPVVGVIGVSQAMEALRIVLELGGGLIGWLNVFDFSAGIQRRLRLRRDPASNGVRTNNF